MGVGELRIDWVNLGESDLGEDELGVDRVDLGEEDSWPKHVYYVIWVNYCVCIQLIILCVDIDLVNSHNGL